MITILTIFSCKQVNDGSSSSPHSPLCMAGDKNVMIINDYW